MALVSKHCIVNITSFAVILVAKRFYFVQLVILSDIAPNFHGLKDFLIANLLINDSLLKAFERPQILPPKPQVFFQPAQSD
jgi:hypothetical protein